MTDKDISKDMQLISDIIAMICDYAVKNNMEPDRTIETIAGNLLALLKISTFNNWRCGYNE